MAVMISGNEIVLSGCVGDPSGWGWEDCFTASDVIIALAQVGNSQDVVIRLNSGGGIATEGSAIHSAIARHQGNVTIIVEGIAASAASVIAMAGDDVVMALGALMMIHDPSGFTVGTIVDHEQQIAALTALADAMATIYAAKSIQTVEACRADMKAELWMTADQAVEKGYADRVEGAVNDNDPVEPSAFNYTLYAHAPDRMVALTASKHWAKKPLHKMEAIPPTPAKPEAVSSQGDDNMTTEAEIEARIAAARAEGKTAGAAEATASALSPSLAADIAKLCNDGGVPTMTASLLAEKGITLEKVKARIDSAAEIKEAVALGRRQNPSAIPETMTAEYIASGKTVVEVRADLFNKMAAADESRPVTGHHRAASGGSDHGGGNANEARAKSKANMEAELKRAGLLPKKEG